VALSITPVASKADLREFIELPYRLHASSPQWVPPLRIERRLFLDPKQNAYFAHGLAQLFLARRDGRVVGRISAQIDLAFNRHQGNRWGNFGFLELEDDPEVMAALTEAAAGWLRARGCDRMVGPMDFSINDESGVLIEGFERDPMLRQPWHPPSYQRLCEDPAGGGLTKAMDLLMWELDIADRARMLPILPELAQKAESEHGVVLRKWSRRRMRAEVDRFAEVYNSAWKRNWHFVPYSEKDLNYLAEGLQLIYDRNWFMMAEKDGETVGAVITFPDLNQVLRKMNGRVLPFGWVHFLRKAKTIDRVRVGFLGVKPEFQHTGIAAKLYVEHFDMAETTPQSGGEMGWILETNDAMNRGMEAMGGRVVKRYRVYERML
jgi:GNAT superfamily N-acetyltransferase